MSEYFRFEDTDRDFPFYRHNPQLSRGAWIALLALIPISFLAYTFVSFESEFWGSVVFCFMLLVPVLYFSGWDYRVLFKKPRKSDVKLAVLLFIGYMIYAIVIGEVLTFFGQSVAMTSDYMSVNLELIVSLVFSMMGEELIKFIPLMFFMRLFFKYTNRRKLSISLSAIIVMIYFGMLHYYPGVTPVLNVLFTQGLGTIFEMYGYVKTKNIFVPYLCHLLTDAFIFTLVLIGLAW